MGFLKKAVKWLIVALLFRYLYNMILALDLNKQTYNHTPGSCKPIKGIEYGSEDLEAVDDTLVVVTSGLRTHHALPGANDKAVGKLFAIPLVAAAASANVSLPVAKELKLTKTSAFDPKLFNPHGISSWKSASDGSIRLYVINHLPDVDAVEVFQLNREKLTVTHLRSIRDGLISSVNDLVAVGPGDKFYITNDFYFRSPILRKVEMYSMLGTGSVVFFDGKEGRIVDQWQHGPNGITTNADRSKLFVSMTGAKGFSVYDITSANPHVIKLVTKVLLSTVVDNLWVDAAGDVWSGGHPVLYLAAEYLKEPRRNKAPTQVIRVHFTSWSTGEDGPAWTVSDPYADDGSLLSGGSAAVFLHNQLLVGTVHHRLMWCHVAGGV